MARQKVILEKKPEELQRVFSVNGEVADKLAAETVE